MLCLDDQNVREIMPFISKPITTYGFHENADVRAVDARAMGPLMEFTVMQKGYEPMAVTLNQPGMHNVQNACAAIAIARELGIADNDTQKALHEFRGAGRRFTQHGEIPFAATEGRPAGTFALVDDYGHHPAEVAATIAAARGAFPGRRLVLIFQPHRYSRMRDLFEDFVRVLSLPDVLLLAEVYAAGEQPIVAADGRALARALRVAGKVDPVFEEDIAEMPSAIMNIVRDGDVVVTMGAGSISGVPSKLVQFEDKKLS
jgi:UDP-N-acetylmuramate--alanine ligase